MYVDEAPFQTEVERPKAGSLSSGKKTKAAKTNK